MATKVQTGPRIVAKDALGGTQVVELLSFDVGAGAWEVQPAGGDVRMVKTDLGRSSALVLDLCLPPQPRPGAAYRTGPSTMLASSGNTTGLGMFATRRIKPGEIILEEHPVMRGALDISLGSRGPHARALIHRFLDLPPAVRAQVLALHRMPLRAEGRAADVSARDVLRLLEREGVRIPKGMAGQAVRFVEVWSCNAFDCGAPDVRTECVKSPPRDVVEEEELGAGLFLALPRANHDCCPRLIFVY